MKDCYTLKNIEKNEKGLLAMTINSTLDGSELMENGEEISRPIGKDDSRPNGKSNDDEDPQWFNEEESD